MAKHVRKDYSGSSGPVASPGSNMPQAGPARQLPVAPSSMPQAIKGDMKTWGMGLLALLLLVVLAFFLWTKTKHKGTSSYFY
jgi:hypothetical protein